MSNAISPQLRALPQSDLSSPFLASGLRRQQEHLRHARRSAGLRSEINFSRAFSQGPAFPLMEYAAPDLDLEIGGVLTSPRLYVRQGPAGMKASLRLLMRGEAGGQMHFADLPADAAWQSLPHTLRLLKEYREVYAGVYNLLRYFGSGPISDENALCLQIAASGRPENWEQQFSQEEAPLGWLDLCDEITRKLEEEATEDDLRLMQILGTSRSCSLAMPEPSAESAVAGPHFQRMAASARSLDLLGR